MIANFSIWIFVASPYFWNLTGGEGQNYLYEKLSKWFNVLKVLEILYWFEVRNLVKIKYIYVEKHKNLRKTVKSYTLNDIGIDFSRWIKDLKML